jgi:hypothetical protein
MSVKPIKPSEAVSLKDKGIPPEVIEAFNELIPQNMKHGMATILQKDVVALIVKKGLKRNDIFDNDWLGIEKIYEKAGWFVSYDAPAYNESYEASFTFEAKNSHD